MKQTADYGNATIDDGTPLATIEPQSSPIVCSYQPVIVTPREALLLAGLGIYYLFGASFGGVRHAGRR